MTIETKVLKLLSSDKYLVKLLESLRTAKTDVSSIWKHEIPENYRKKNMLHSSELTLFTKLIHNMLMMKLCQRNKEFKLVFGLLKI